MSRSLASAPPPDPFHILRIHSAPLSVISFNPSNTLLYAGDQDGYISIIDLRTRRALSYWKAHETGVLTVEEWNGRLISHGRDNKIHLYERSNPGPSFVTGSGAANRTPPKISRTLDVNSLNFCRFSLCPSPMDLDLPLHDGQGESEIFDNQEQAGQSSKSSRALLAVPNLVDSELADIYTVPSFSRLHASVNLPPVDKGKKPALNGNTGRTGLIMAMRLGFEPKGHLSLLLAYEDGRVEVWRARGNGSPGIQGESSTPEWWKRSDARLDESGERIWRKAWEAKGHNEAIMGMAVDSSLSTAFTVSADHLLVRYDLSQDPTAETGMKRYSTGQIGNSSIAIASDDLVIAVGGWDGQIRLFSAASLKPLGTLSYHREGVQALAFPQRPNPAENETTTINADDPSTISIHFDEPDDDNDDEEERHDLMGGVPPRSRWLASGGKDRRIALWGLKDFAVGR